MFRAKGTVVKERNSLDIFKSERLAENPLPLLRVGEKVKVAALSVEQGTTTVGAMRWGEA